ncbi:MAG: hypothetical protein MSH22_13060 [Spirochaetia bacterium]|nr:hypothetical protein [Spirochaetia bacterium]
MKRSSIICLIVSFLLLFVSCATTGKFNQARFDEALFRGEYDTCADMLERKKESKHNLLKKSLDVNMLRYQSGDYLASGKGFLESKTIFQKTAGAYTPAMYVQSAIVNEENTLYYGPVYERILTYSMRAIDSIKLDALDNAVGVMNDYTGTYRDIINDLILKQRQIEDESGNFLENSTVSKSLDMLYKGGINIDTNKFKAPKKYQSQYETSPLMSYLGTVVYAAYGDNEHARDFYSVLKKDNSSLDLSEVLEVPQNKGHLEVLALSGLIGQRSECSSKLIFVGAVEGVPIYFKFTYPQFLPQKHLVDAVEISLSNGEVKKAALVENFDAAVLDDVKSKQYGAFNRSVVRNIVKNATALTTVISSRILMENAPSDVVRSIAQISYNSSRLAFPIAMPLIVDAEKADIRQAAFFPHMANSAGFSVKPGSYDVTIRYLSKGEVVEEEIIKDVIVENGKVTVVAGSTAK